MALFEMKFKANQSARIRQSGHCVSGLRIKQATQRVLKLNKDEVQHVILNVGSVDIAEGKQSIEIIHDFAELLAACDSTGIIPIVTTLPPLPNYYLSNKHVILNAFNHYIRTTTFHSYPVIDLNKGMIYKDGKTNINMYESAPVYVSGSKTSFVLWNRVGRKRMFSMIMKNIGQALIYLNEFIGAYF